MVDIERGGADAAPVITVPLESALYDALVVKLEEYKMRFSEFGEYKHPEQVLFETFVLQGQRSALDALLKADLLQRVLSEGEISYMDFQTGVMSDEVYRQSIEARPDYFGGIMLNACNVINAYCSNNTMNVRGGTGLKIPSQE